MRAVAILVALTGCLQHQLVPCGDALCPVGVACIADRCITDDQLAACADKADGEPCATGFEAGYCVDRACIPSLCGNAIVELGEACDDGNVLGEDGCSARCDSDETCGNGVVDLQLGEQCDGGLAGLSGDGCSARCTIEIDQWRDHTTKPMRARSMQASAYDSDRRRVVMFGGQLIVGPTWEWDGQNWRAKQPPVSPPFRTFAAMAYDPIRHRTVLFGGNNTNYDGAARLADTWEWDGTTWTAVTPTMSPPARSNHVMVFDPVSQRVLLFGGTTATGVIGGTWSYDGTTWTEVAIGTGPSPRHSAAVAVDPVRGRIVLFGGRTNSASLDETWEWTGSAWTQPTVSTTPPSPRYGANMAFDATLGKVVLFSGITNPVGNVTTDDLYSWDGASWTPLSPMYARPTGRAYATLIGGAYLVMFGGQAEGFAENAEMWAFHQTYWQPIPANPTPFSSGAASAGLAYDVARGVVVAYDGSRIWEWDHEVWTERVTLYFSPRKAGVVYDEARRQIVIVISYSGTLETWTWNGTQLTRLLTFLSTNNNDMSLAYDAARRVVVYVDTSDVFNAQTWTLDGMDWTRQGTPADPRPRGPGLMTYDRWRERVVWLGTSGTWEWDGQLWAERGPRPAQQQSHGLAVTPIVYDPITQRTLAFGGMTPAGVFLDTTYAWDGSEWTLRVPAVAPTARTNAAATFDRLNQRVVLYGGYDGSGGYRDTWSYGFASASVPSDACNDTDTDGDGLVGCADPDCAGRCTPFCLPGETCDATLPHCGDGTCSMLEDRTICQADCP